MILAALGSSPSYPSNAPLSFRIHNGILFVYETPEGGAMTILVHPRVLQKRPWLDEREILSTWMDAARTLPRQEGYEPNQKMAVGWDWHGRLTELIPYEGEEDNEWIIFHVAPARKKFLAEMGFSGTEIRQLIGRR